ncbi:MAG: TlyA family RNA methyltransferase [Gorillibacterium sp.]|nr:TlyA family RNA methyltransferase [Gorillibacterium sp.]
MNDKERVDLLLVEQGFFDSREKAKAALMAGLVFAGTERIEKAGTKISRQTVITVKGAIHPYVSRGGLKLEKALKHFDIDVQGAIMLDVGASTGGFTDCALQNGAAHVYAVDVGYNQLDWSIRSDTRVTVMERINFRYLKKEELPGEELPNFATIDVSFISLKLILPPLTEILLHGGEVVALIKPQFEAGRDKVGKSGVIRDSAVHREVLQTVLGFAATMGYHLLGLTFSPITGGEGNIEFLAHWKLVGAPEQLEQIVLNERIAQTVAAASSSFSS